MFVYVAKYKVYGEEEEVYCAVNAENMCDAMNMIMEEEGSVNIEEITLTECTEGNTLPLTKSDYINLKDYYRNQM